MTTKQLTKKQILTIASFRNIKNRSKMAKQQLLQELRDTYLIKKYSLIWKKRCNRAEYMAESYKDYSREQLIRSITMIKKSYRCLKQAEYYEKCYNVNRIRKEKEQEEANKKDKDEIVENFSLIEEELDTLLMEKMIDWRFDKPNEGAYKPIYLIKREEWVNTDEEEEEEERIVNN